MPASDPSHFSAIDRPSLDAVYHITESGWKKVIGADVGQLHYEYYPEPELHPTFNPVI